MKKMIQLTMAGIAALTFANTQVFAHDLVLEDDMAEGISLSEENNTPVSYKYDSANPGGKESMTELVFFPESNQDTHHFNGDPSTPSAENMMTEGICLKTLFPLVAQN